MHDAAAGRSERVPRFMEGHCTEVDVRQLCFLVSDIGAAKRVLLELHAADIGSSRARIVARDDRSLEGLPVAGILQRSDFWPATRRGVMLGAVVGMLVGVLEVALSGHGILSAPAGVLLTTIAGTGLGAWSGGMVGVSVSNTRLRRFAQAIESGKLLVIVRVPKAQLAQVESLARRHSWTTSPSGSHTSAPPTKPWREGPSNV